MNKIIAATLFAFAVSSTARAATPAQVCQEGKNKLAGALALCRQKAEASRALSGDIPKYQQALGRCASKIGAKWPRLEATAAAQGSACPSVGDITAIEGVVAESTMNVATALSGGVLQDCPAGLSSCQGSLGTCTGTLGTCTANLTTCTTTLSTTQTSLATCQTDLTTCQATPQGQLLTTGQTNCYDPSGSMITCAGTGQDGELQKGLARSYTDNGDGTITDNRTGLTWEKLSDDGTIHDKDNLYNWSAGFSKIADLNAMSFAGFNDWRFPNEEELQSLLNFGTSDPAAFPAFQTGCTLGCTVSTCSCTASENYWSSTSYAANPTLAWHINFINGGWNADNKATFNYHVRAVRSQL